MNNKDLMECIAAEEARRKIEQKDLGSMRCDWCPKDHKGWDTTHIIYRIAPEPPKQGRWVRKEIELCGTAGEYRCLENGRAVDALARIPGFGGIEYVDPRNPETKPAISMSPVYFDVTGNWIIGVMRPGSNMDHFRPGVPVAAWFWEE